MEITRLELNVLVSPNSFCLDLAVISRVRDSDLDALNKGVKQLQTAIQELDESIGDMPIYQPATETVDGLFSAPDKKKFNLITVSHPVDLDGLVAKVEALEGGNNG